MGKVIYEFDLDEPDDRQAIKQHAKADDMAGFIWHMVHNNDKINTLQEMYEKIDDLLEEYNINSEELTS